MNKKTLTFLGISLTLAGCSDKAVIKKKMSNQTGTVDPIVENNQKSTKQWRDQLKRLAESPAPTDLKMGAMCYDMVGYYTDSYSCSTCMNKTIFPSGSLRSSVAGELSEIKLKVETLQKLGLIVKLDDMYLCDHCYTEKYGSTEGIEKGSLYWEIDNGNKVIRTNYQDFDFYILRDFLKQKDKVVGPQENETPLKKYIPRLKELLLGETGEK